MQSSHTFLLVAFRNFFENIVLYAIVKMDALVSTESPKDCIKLLQDYLPQEFKTLTDDDIIVSVQTGGLLNTLKLVTRKRDNYRVLIRQYGGNVLDGAEFRSLMSPLSWQLLIFYELSKRGIGPKLLGVFEGGRIEEFISSHTLTPEEFEDEEILKAIAINTAIIHSVKLPLDQNSLDMEELFLQMYATNMSKYTPETYIEKYRERLTSVGINAKLFKKIVETDWIIESKKLKNVTDSFEPRIGLVLRDNNFRNILVRDNKKNGQLKVCLIDFEGCRYNSVITDIGARIVNQLFHFGGAGAEKATGFKVLSAPKRELFIREYLKEFKRQETPDNVSTTESEVEQWMKELDYSILLNLMNFSMIPLAMEFLIDKDISFAVSTTQFLKFINAS